MNTVANMLKAKKSFRPISIIFLVVVSLLDCSQSAVGFPTPGDGVGGGEGPYHHYLSSRFTGEHFTTTVDSKIPAPRVSHYTCIGMPIKEETVEGMIEEFKSILESKNNVRKVSIPDCDDYYLIYWSMSGGELWGTVQERNKFGWFFPHFSGKSRVTICVLTKEPSGFYLEDGRTNMEWLDGSFLGVLDWDFRALDYLSDSEKVELSKMVVIAPEKGVLAAGVGFTNPDTKQAFVAFSFDCPNFAFFGKDTPLPAAVTVQLAGFAEEIKTFDSIKDYEREREEERRSNVEGDVDTTFASQFFGSDIELDDENRQKNKKAVVAGHVVETELKVNELTGESFYWALLRTAGDMEIDVVIHPALLERSYQKPPQVGGVVRGFFWLSGLLLGDKDAGD